MKQLCIGDVIKKRRLELNLTQEDVCLGLCDTSTMSRIENCSGQVFL